MRQALLIAMGMVAFGCEVLVTVDAGPTSGDAGRVDAGTAALSLEAFCAAVGNAQCEAGVRCGYYDSLAGCAALQSSPRAIDLCKTGRAAVAAGRARFDAVAAQACLTSLSTACQANACVGAFVGQAPVGSDCFFTAFGECAAGATCDITQTCPGRCVASGVAGAVVSSPLLCAADHYGQLRPNTDGGFQSSYSCEPRKPLGAQCTGVDCAVGLVCNQESQRCEAARQEHASCTSADGGSLTGGLAADVCDVYAALTCTRAGPTTFTCERRATRDQPCGSCRFDLQCGSPDGGAARCLPLGTLGQFCNGFNGCIDDTFCRASSGSPLGAGVCVARGGYDAGCNSSFECQTGLDCIAVPSDAGFGSTNLCRTAPGLHPIGAACSNAP